jgi:hypothetical protein
MSRLTVVASLVVTTLALAACGGGGSSGASSAGAGAKIGAATTDAPSALSSATVDACALLTKAQVSAALGSTFKQGVPADPASRPMGGSQCVWSDDGPPVKTFSASILTDGTLSDAFRKAGQTPAVQFAGIESQAPRDDFETLGGVGDKAFRFKGNVVVLKGSALLRFSTLLGDSATAIAGLKSLAATATASAQG